MIKEKLVTGITATGQITIGNYIGLIKNLVTLQDKYQLFVFVADLHAITIDIDPQELSKNRQKIVALYIACGLDPQKVTFFYQSDILAHTQLAWIFQNNTSIGELMRMVQFKDKSQRQKNGTESIKTGILTYPTLMAADILLYNPKLVPVGKDQKQHLELTKKIAIRFNHKYGDTFVVPEPLISPIGNKIMSLVDPQQKMSKSDPNSKAYIALLDDPQKAQEKILHAKTDSENKIVFSENKDGVNNLITIYASLNNYSIEQATKILAKASNYFEMKKIIGEKIVELLTKIQTKYKDALKIVEKVTNDGAKIANQIANKQLKIIQQKIGFNDQHS